jgi:hypothetical protein
VADQAHSNAFTCVSLTPDVNLTALLQDHVIADECGQDGICPALQSPREKIQAHSKTDPHLQPTVSRSAVPHRSSMTN